MSEHTQGKLIAKYEWLVPEAHQDRPIGNSSNPIHDRDNYAQVVAQVRGRYHDQDANARRLAAAWNACEGMTTDAIEALSGIGSLGDLKASERGTLSDRIEYLQSLVAERDAMLGKRPCQNNRCNELNAARALLREVIADAGIASHIDACHRAQVYLDTCDKPGEPT